MTDAIHTDSSITRGHAGISILVFIILGLLTAIAQIAIRHDSVLIANRVKEWKQFDGMFNDSRFYANAQERLLYQTIPTADYSHGGVYFTGASVLQLSLKLWDLPPDEQADIHNYCLVGGSHTRQAQFIRYLVEHENLLKAGGDQNCIITELAFASACRSPAAENKINEALWTGFFTRYGMFTYDPVKGLNRVSMPDWQWKLNLFELRTHVFWSWALQCLQGNRDTYLQPVERRDPATTLQRWTDRFGSNWQAEMDMELKQYADLLDYLLARHVKIAAVFMPESSWSAGFAPEVRYRQKVLALLAGRGIPVLDLIHKVPDNDFADSVHLGYQGSEMIQPDLIHLAEQYRLKINHASEPNPR